MAGCAAAPAAHAATHASSAIRRARFGLALIVPPSDRRPKPWRCVRTSGTGEVVSLPGGSGPSADPREEDNAERRRQPRLFRALDEAAVPRVDPDLLAFLDVG